MRWLILHLPSRACTRTLVSCCCWLNNRALEQRIKSYRRRGETIGFVHQCQWLTSLRQRIFSVAAVPTMFARDALRRVDRRMKRSSAASNLEKNRLPTLAFAHALQLACISRAWLFGPPRQSVVHSETWLGTLSRRGPTHSGQAESAADHSPRSGKDKVFVHDFGSTNGTFINDRQIKGEIELLDGDRLRVGPLTFAVHLEQAPVEQPQRMPPAKETLQKQASGQPARPPARELGSSAGDEDEAAATLLAMQESPDTEAGPRSEVPEGSTVHDLPIPIVAEKEKEKPKQPSGDTSASAKSILDKYLKRPRPG
jgi:hypothetical protein